MHGSANPRPFHSLGTSQAADGAVYQPLCGPTGGPTRGRPRCGPNAPTQCPQRAHPAAPRLERAHPPPLGRLQQGPQLVPVDDAIAGGERGVRGGGRGDGRRGLSARLPIPRRATAACHPRPRHPLPLHMQSPTPWTAHPSTSAAAKRARRPSYVASASGVQASTDGTQSGWDEGGAWGKRMRGY